MTSATNKFDRNKFVTSCSMALDFMEKSLRDNVVNHGKRVCLIAMSLAEAMGIPPEDRFDLYAYAMLHDNGITHKLYNAMSKHGVSLLETAQLHCTQGEENLVRFPLLKKRENIILYHHENHNGSGFCHLTGSDIPLFSQIIHMADRAEVYYRSLPDYAAVKRQVESERGTSFSPEMCDAFAEISDKTAFWLGLDDAFVSNELSTHTPAVDMDLSLEQLRDVAELFSRIIDGKSPFTARHSKGLAEKAVELAGFYGFAPERKLKFEVAADLHDIGKMAVPNAILDKPGRLDADEMDVIRSHTFYTRKALEQLPGFEDITEWAANHHERLDGKGYPYGFAEDRLDFESRLMACLDVYQALTEDRPYRQGMSHGQAIEIMGRMADSGALSSDIVKDVDGYFDEK